jgi:predicted O-linked N-acetylglucosamine transferase (SPINDLY family)
VQANWLGYFATTGVAEIDWFVGDPNVCPPGDESHFTEKIWRLPETYLCFTPPTSDVPVSPLPALNNGYITFGCFNHIGKLNDAVVALWSRILKQIPDARLLLKAQQLGDVTMIEQTRARFAAHGVADRLLLEGPSSRTDYFAAYGRIDIALDPFPYPGGTTSVEALWMGVPVLTLRGNRFLSRAGENIMRNVGLPEWIAQDGNDYVLKAAAFASKPEALSALRCNLRNQALASPMFDATRFSRYFEEALWNMWHARSSV